MPQREREGREGAKIVTIGWYLLAAAILVIVASAFKPARLVAVGQKAMNAASARMSPPISKNE